MFFITNSGRGKCSFHIPPTQGIQEKIQTNGKNRKAAQQRVACDQCSLKREKITVIRSEEIIAITKREKITIIRSEENIAVTKREKIIVIQREENIAVTKREKITVILCEENITVIKREKITT